MGHTSELTMTMHKPPSVNTLQPLETVGFFIQISRTKDGPSNPNIVKPV